MLGASGPFVHGMLSLLAVKQHVAQHSVIENEPESSWLKFRALFRAPIPHNNALVLTTDSYSRGLRFHVRDDAASVEYLRGAYGFSSNPEQKIADKPWVINSEAQIADQRWCDFYFFYRDVQYPWIAMNAIVFADFIQSKVDTLRELTIPHANKVFGLGGGKTTIHASHTVTFDASLLATHGQGKPNIEKVSYRVLEPDLILGKNHLICTMSLVVMANSRTIMLIEIGLVIKN